MVSANPLTVNGPISATDPTRRTGGPGGGSVAVLVVADGSVPANLSDLIAQFDTVVLTRDPATAATTLTTLSAQARRDPYDHPRELTAVSRELTAVVREPLPAGDAVVADDPVAVAGDLVVDLRYHETTWRRRPVYLTTHEQVLLFTLMQRPRRVWRYDELHERVWGGVYLGDPGIVHSAIKRLRRRLVQAGVRHRISTVRCVGFRLEDD